MNLRLHIIGLPNTEVTKAYNSCAFSQKTLKLCQMMKAQGNTVYLYAGGDVTEAPCDEFISCISRKEQAKLLDADHYVKVSFDTSKPLWQIFNNRLVYEINKRKQPRDIVCFCMGSTFADVAKKVGDGVAIVESGIGYSSVFAPFQVFESYAQRHAVGAQHRDSSQTDGRFYDEVIPNYFDVADFPFSNKKDDYLLFVGRMIQRKGLKIVEEIAEYSGKKVILAGMGATQKGDTITCQDITIKGKNLEYVGEIDFKKRGELMSKASAVLCPTIYVEPFCGVNVESQLCGTPVISTDWGAFVETIEQGKTGFRCKTLKQFIEATEKVKELDYKYIRERAIREYSLEAIAPRYQEYFERVYTVFDKGWYTL